MKKNVIVTLADSNYFELLNELINSIKQFKESENTAICVLDAGLTETQKQDLKIKVDDDVTLQGDFWDISADSGLMQTATGVTVQPHVTVWTKVVAECGP